MASYERRNLSFNINKKKKQKEKCGLTVWVSTSLSYLHCQPVKKMSAHVWIGHVCAGSVWTVIAWLPLADNCKTLAKYKVLFIA